MLLVNNDGVDFSSNIDNGGKNEPSKITDNVKLYLEENEFVLESFSVGRQGAKPDGQPVYMVSYFLNKELKQSIAVITSPSGHESCMMYKSFDLIYPGEDT